MRLAFTISLKLTETNQSVVKNLGHAIVKKSTIKFSGNEVMSTDDSDVFMVYRDLWKTDKECPNSQYQGIYTTTNRNATKLWVGAENGGSAVVDSAIAAVYGNRFYITLDFEVL